MPMSSSGKGSQLESGDPDPLQTKTGMSCLALYCMVELFCTVECFMELKAWPIKHSVGTQFV